MKIQRAHVPVQLLAGARELLPGRDCSGNCSWYRRPCGKVKERQDRGRKRPEEQQILRDGPEQVVARQPALVEVDDGLDTKSEVVWSMEW